jgi:ATP-dependent DNA helicase RecG
MLTIIGSIEKAWYMPISLDAIKSDPTTHLDLVEDQWFERKGAGVASRDVARVLVAFANAEGGTLAIGVSKEHGLGGLAASPKRVNELRQAAIDFTEPSLMQKVHVVPCLDQRGHPDSVLMLEVEPSEQMHRLKDGAVFLRVGDETRSLNHEQAMHLAHDKGVSQYDREVVPHSTMDDFDQEAIARYRTVLGSRLQPQDLLKGRGLFEDRGSRVGATWAGVRLRARPPIPRDQAGNRLSHERCPR